MTTELNIEGMTCGHCAEGVRRALEAVPGVVAAEVNLDLGRAVVRGSTDVATLLNAVEEEGYSAALAYVKER